MRMLKRYAAVIVVFMITVCAVSGMAQDWKGKGRLEGLVLSQDGTPIPNARVKLTHLKLKSSREVFTNESGRFVAGWIKGGLWNVDVEAEGHLPRKVSYTVSEILKNPPIEIMLTKTDKTVVKDEIREKVEASLNEGNDLYDQGKFAEAAAKYKEILVHVPELYQINVNIGNCYYQLEDYDSAIPYFEAVLANEENNKDAVISLVNIYLEKEELEKAMGLLSRITEEDINNPVTLYNIGTNLFNKGQSGEAIRYYERAIKLDPEMSDAYYQLGMCYVAQNIKDKAKEIFIKYLEIDPDSERAEQVRTFLRYLE